MSPAKGLIFVLGWNVGLEPTMALAAKNYTSFWAEKFFHKHLRIDSEGTIIRLSRKASGQPPIPEPE